MKKMKWHFVLTISAVLCAILLIVAVIMLENGLNTSVPDDGSEIATQNVESSSDESDRGSSSADEDTGTDGRLKCRYKFLSASNKNQEELNIYIPTDVGYYGINFLHTVNKDINCDVWRIDNMIAFDDNLSDRYDITSPGEFEAAIRLKGRSDFSGGVAHGDEIVISIQCYIDNAPVNISSLDNLTSFDEMRIIRTSVFYDPADPTTEIATHTVEYTFNIAGVRIQQSVNWLVSETCRESYMAMFPVARTTKDVTGNTVVVSEYYTDDKISEVYDVSEAGKSEYPQKWNTGVKKMTLWSDSLGIETSLEVIESTTVPGANYATCSPSSTYNKLYFSITGIGSGVDYKVSANEVWETITHYAVNIGK